MLAINTLGCGGGQHSVDGVEAVEVNNVGTLVEVERLVQSVEVIMLNISVTVILQLGQLEEVGIQNAVAAAVEGIVVDVGVPLQIQLYLGIHQAGVHNLAQGIIKHFILGVVAEYLGIG